MSDPNQQCPPNWRLVTSPVRACTRSTSERGACDSAVFTSGGIPYSRVCGRVNAIQRGATDGIQLTNPPGLEGIYVDGISLTHGAVGSRQHIWTFISALYESGLTRTPNVCPCTNTEVNWPHQIPSYIGNAYFCDTGDDMPDFSDTAVYSDDPLWDGEGCGPTSSCCQFNNPPWFCKELGESTTDDIEARICLNERRAFEDIEVTVLEVFIQ